MSIIHLAYIHRLSTPGRLLFSSDFQLLLLLLCVFLQESPFWTEYLALD